MILIVDQQHRL